MTKILHKIGQKIIPKATFTRTVFRTIFICSTFDLFNAMCEQHHRNSFNPFLNGVKNVTCKPGFTKWDLRPFESFTVVRVRCLFCLNFRLLSYESIMTLDVDKWPIFSLLDVEFLATVRTACVFGSSGNEAIIITKEDDVYALGSNCSGCLGTW